MSQRLVGAIGVMVVVLFAPARADAMGFLSWLDRLSGPGPFWGYDVQLEVACFPAAPDTDAQPFGGRVSLGTCRDRLLKRHRLILLATGSAAVAANNPLDYGDRGHQTRSTAVSLYRAGAAAHFVADRALELGVGAELFHFAGPRFDNFNTSAVTLRAAVRPLLLICPLRKNEKNGWLIVEVDRTHIFGNVTAADFGAPADPWTLDDRDRLQLGLYIDFYRLFRR